MTYVFLLITWSVRSAGFWIAGFEHFARFAEPRLDMGTGFDLPLMLIQPL
jgi:hypothetical protein